MPDIVEHGYGGVDIGLSSISQEFIGALGYSIVGQSAGMSAQLSAYSSHVRVLVVLEAARAA